MYCENCNAEHNGSYGSGRFCSNKCARGCATKFNRKEINEKVSKALTGSRHGFVVNTCPNCNQQFEVRWSYRNKKYCSKTCAVKISGSMGGRKSANSQQRRSKNEILFYELCKGFFDNVKHNEPMFNKWDADIIIEDLKIAIMWNGIWHYKQISKNQSLTQVQSRDKIRLDQITKCGYRFYIIRDMGSYNPLFVHEQFEKFKEWLSKN